MRQFLYFYFSLSDLKKDGGNSVTSALCAVVTMSVAMSISPTGVGCVDSARDSSRQGTIREMGPYL